MGTDCKTHIEIKDADGVWHHYTAWHVPRNYRLFTRMCGVRRVEGVAPIAPPRPPPSNVTKVTAASMERANESFMITGAELETVIDEEVAAQRDFPSGGYDGVWSLHHRGGAGYLFGNGYRLWGDETHGFTDVRVILCFD